MIYVVQLGGHICPKNKGTVLPSFFFFFDMNNIVLLNALNELLLFQVKWRGFYPQELAQSVKTTFNEVEVTSSNPQSPLTRTCKKK